MNGVFAALCLFVMLAGAVTSCRKLRTLACGGLACTLTIAGCFVLSVGLELDAAIMADAFTRIMLVVTAYTMWVHSRATIRTTLAKTYIASTRTAIHE